MAPRTTRIPLPRPAPEVIPPATRPREVEGEVITRREREQVVIWEDADEWGGGTVDERFGPIGRASRPPIETRPQPKPRGRAGSIPERGPFGTKQQGDVVIVGRSPPVPPFSIGGVPVHFPPRGRVKVVRPVPKPPERRAQPTRTDRKSVV